MTSSFKIIEPVYHSVMWYIMYYTYYDLCIYILGVQHAIHLHGHKFWMLGMSVGCSNGADALDKYSP